MTQEIRLRQSAFDWLQAQMVTITKKATKLGVPAPVITVLKDEWVEEVIYAEWDVLKVFSEFVTRRYLTITVDGQIPKLNDWKLVAVVEHLDGANLLRQLPPYDADIEERFRLEPSTTCDHCKTSRNRNESFVVQHDNGQQMQVGRKCLKDFTGHKDPEQIAKWATFLSGIVRSAAMGEDEDFAPKFRSEKMDDIVTLLTWATSVCRINKGYISLTAARAASEAGGYMYATSEQVNDLLHPAPTRNYKEREENAKELAKYAPTEADKNFALKAIDWAKTQQDTSDYCHNLRVVSGLVAIGAKHRGLAVSIVGSYCNMIKRERAAARAAEEALTGGLKPSTHQGKPGDRLVLDVTAIKIKPLEFSTLYNFQDEQGNQYSWFCSGNGLDGMQEGDAARIAGTVKGHNLFNNQQVTNLTRVIYK